MKLVIRTWSENAKRISSIEKGIRMKLNEILKKEVIKSK